MGLGAPKALGGIKRLPKKLLDSILPENSIDFSVQIQVNTKKKGLH